MTNTWSAPPVNSLWCLAFFEVASFQLLTHFFQYLRFLIYVSAFYIAPFQIPFSNLIELHLPLYQPSLSYPQRIKANLSKIM